MEEIVVSAGRLDSGIHPFNTKPPMGKRQRVARVGTEQGATVHVYGQAVVLRT